MLFATDSIEDTSWIKGRPRSLLYPDELLCNELCLPCFRHILYKSPSAAAKPLCSLFLAATRPSVTYLLCSQPDTLQAHAGKF